MGWAAISLTSQREAKRQLWWPWLRVFQEHPAGLGGAGAPRHTGQQSGQWARAGRSPASVLGGGALFTERLTWLKHIPLPWRPAAPPPRGSL